LETIFAGDDVTAQATAIANADAAAVADAYIKNGTAKSIADALLVAAEYRWQETGNVMALIVVKEQAVKREDFAELMVGGQPTPSATHTYVKL
jgi:hypothetical protein